MARKTKLMLQVEAQQGRPLDELIPELINELGLTDAAEKLGVSKATLGYWALKFRIRIQRVALRPGETLEIKKRL